MGKEDIVSVYVSDGALSLSRRGVRDQPEFRLARS